jgi:DMSO/TMAO reductase YedYZ molybdopterin-dependent catalytic subunit
VTPLSPIGLLAPRQYKKGLQRVPVNRTADQARVTELLDAVRAGNWQLSVKGAKPYTVSLDEILAMAPHEAHFPISCVEGWSVGVQWRGVRLLDIVRRAGGTGPQVSHALLATHINGDPLKDDHGYPLRLIAPDRAGVLNTKWLSMVEVL